MTPKRTGTNWETDASIARAMETDPRLLPVLPELLADVWELGTSSAQVLSALSDVALPPESLVLDLGCGKGAVAVALAERFGVRVEGVDALPPFLEAAQRLAEERGVASRCRFQQGDIRSRLGRSDHYDAALLLDVGPVLGDWERTEAGLRTLVRPGGYILIEDAFLAEGTAARPETEGYVSRSEMHRSLTASGDRLLREVAGTPEVTRAFNQEMAAKIRGRAKLLKSRRPDLSGLIDDFVKRQERETRILGTQVLSAVWVLERAR